MEQQQDERLWRIARKRANFRRNVFSYIFVNLFLWAIWWFTSGQHNENLRTPWPIWVTIA